jgi:molybdenum cofactor biosynthesis enzyme MoaA
MEEISNNRKTIIFIDIRGFSKASTEVTDFNLLVKKFINDYYESITNNFQNDFIKYMGDGAMIISELTDISQILERCYNIINDFSSIIKKYVELTNSSLSLGFGITKGFVQEIENPLSNKHLVLRDYVNNKINLASRLCYHARPNGIIILNESFPDPIPEPYSKSFTSTIFKKIKGFESKDEIRCWIDNNVIPSETDVTEVLKIDSEFHVTGFCFFDDELLLHKRPVGKEIAPLKWAGPGGKINSKMSFEEGLKIKFKEITGLNIKEITLLDTYFIDDQKIPGIIYYCEVDEIEPNSIFENANFRKFKLYELINNNDVLPEIKYIKKAFDLNLSKSRTNMKIKIDTKLRIQIDHKCNYNCITCHKDNVRKEITKTSIQDQINVYSKLSNIMNINSVSITGGEPFINDGIWELIQSLRAKNDILPIKVVTNGSIITNEIIEKISSNNIDIKISIYGFSDQTAENITRKEQSGYFYKISKVISELYKKNINITVNILMNSHIEKDIPVIIKYVKEIDENINIKIIEMMHPIDKQGDSLYKPIDSCYNKWKYECCNLLCYECFVKRGPIILPNGEIQLCENVPNKIKDILINNKIQFSCVDYSKNNMKQN